MVPSPLMQAKPLAGSVSVITESRSPSASVSLASTSTSVKSPARTGAESGFATGAVLPATTWDRAVIPAHSLSAPGAAAALEVIAKPDRRSENIATREGSGPGCHGGGSFQGDGYVRWQAPERVMCSFAAVHKREGRPAGPGMRRRGSRRVGAGVPLARAGAVRTRSAASPGSHSEPREASTCARAPGAPGVVCEASRQAPFRFGLAVGFDLHPRHPIPSFGAVADLVSPVGRRVGGISARTLDPTPNPSSGRGAPGECPVLVVARVGCARTGHRVTVQCAARR